MKRRLLGQLRRVSLKTRVALFTLAIFVLCIWLLALYATRMLREDMQRLLGEHQFSTVSFVAAEVNQQFRDRFNTMELVARDINPAMMANPPSLRTLLEQRPVFRRMFNAGTFITDRNGATVASIPSWAERVDVDFADRSFVATAITQGKPMISPPFTDKQLKTPVFYMAVPVHDQQGQVIGALMAVIHLGLPNFLDKVAENRYGQNGGYLLVAPQHRLVITATDQRRSLQPVPAPGRNAMHDRYMQGYEGFGIALNSRGVEELTAAKSIPAAGWFVVAALPTEEAFAPIHAMQRRMLVATVFLSLLAGGLTWWILMRQLSPMLATVRRLADMSNEGHPLQPLPIIRQDEIGQLIGGVNHLIKTLELREFTLREREARLRATLDSALDAIISIDSSGRLIDVNPAAEAIFGWKKDELLGRLVSETLIPPVHRHAHDQGLARFVQTGQQRILNRRVEVTALRRDGSEFPVELTITSIRQDDKDLFTAYLRDITQRKLADEQLRLAAGVFTHAREAIMITNLEGTIIDVNDAFTRITGYSRDEALGRNPRLLGSGRQDQAFFAAMWRDLLEKDYWYGEIWNRRKDGELFAEMLTISAVRDARGVAQQFIALFSDITERKRVDDELKASELRWKEANAAKITFLTQMSHELRTPLDTILGNAQLLARPQGRAMWAQGLTSIQQSGWHLLGMIDEILDLARGVAGKLTIEPHPVDWPGFLYGVAQNAKVLASGNTNDFSLVTTGEPLSAVVLDEGRVRQVLDNLLANAARHTRHGWIRLECAVAPQPDARLRLDFAVADSGEGIALADQNRVFLPFERGSTSALAGGKGTGMGLAISRQLVEAMGGQLTLQSTPGQGACFRFWLIAGTEAVPTARAEQAIPTGYQGAQRRILVVEDEPANRQVMLRLLQACGFAVLEAASGRAAVQTMAGPLAVDLVLTDQFMADGDGWMVLQAVAARWPQVPVILMSAAPPKRPDGWPQALTYSAQLLKPLNHAELLKQIGELLGLRWLVGEPDASALPARHPTNQHLLDDAELAKLRLMIAGGRVSEIIDWAATLESGSPGNEQFARAVSAAARHLDLVSLQVLASSSEQPGHDGGPGP